MLLGVCAFVHDVLLKCVNDKLGLFPFGVLMVLSCEVLVCDYDVKG